MATINETPFQLHAESPSSEGGRDYAERQLQNFLIRNPGELGIPNAIVVAAEYQTEVGRIDMLVSSGPLELSAELWVVELKAGAAGRDAIGQIASYIGAVGKEYPDKVVFGLLVATDFDQSCLAAHRVIHNVELKRVRIQYVLEKAVPMVMLQEAVATAIARKQQEFAAAIARENLANQSFVIAKRSDGGSTVRCKRCGEDRQVSPGTQAFSCTACGAWNTF